MNTDAARLLDELGLAATHHGAQLVDSHVVDGYIHHSRTPVALVGYTLTVPAIARGRFPKMTFIDLIQKAPSLDGLEKAALAALCGIHESRQWHDPAAFGREVLAVIERYDLHPFFERVDQAYGTGGEHYTVRPRGIDSQTGDTIPEEIKKWKAVYRAATPLRQLMTATVLQLYRSGDDPYWMVRVKKDWHASEGIEILRAENALQDWARLYALYSGW